MKNITTKKTVIGLIIAGSILLSSPVTASIIDRAEDTKENNVKVKSNAKLGSADESSISEKVKAPETEISVSSPRKQNDQPNELESDNRIEENSEDSSTVNFCIGDCEEKTHLCDLDEVEEEDKADCKKATRLLHNRRDGFYTDLSAVSSVGDNIYSSKSNKNESEFDLAISYRAQLLGLFIESPGISTRRVQGMYSMPAWGLNFYNSDDWSFDLFYQYSTRGIEGLEGIQARNKDKRAGLRMTGFFENSQFQAIYSPISRNNIGSDGIEASISYSYNWQFKNWNYYVNAGMQYRSKEVTPYGSESFIDDDLSFREGINYSAELGFEYPLSTDWVFGGFAGYNALSERATLIRQDSIEDGYRAGILLTYAF